MGKLTSSQENVIASVFGLIGSKTGAEIEKPGKDLEQSEFVGTWEVEDSNGELFEIVLSAEGEANATRAGEGMTGTWEQDAVSAVIDWDTGWTTKITRTGDGYVKTAYDTTSAAPTNTSQAEKVS